ncbi:hypothetical protein AAFF_G00340610 [Aldrovandia affinis]|uniref:Uncharacterized protein n=1 Tax=Aldrovandia affinis TaxID=143900 RepID=A0AAD7SKN9_9TELE|nr:hypothetical protein AAFF_G00340610 [Aldrovandia affinis]
MCKWSYFFIGEENALERSSTPDAHLTGALENVLPRALQESIQSTHSQWSPQLLRERVQSPMPHSWLSILRPLVLPATICYNPTCGGLPLVRHATPILLRLQTAESSKAGVAPNLF